MTTNQNRVGIHGNASDRALGDKWEQEFIGIAALFGFDGWQVSKIKGPVLTHNGRRYISPDVWILRRGDKQYACEVKHKAPTKKDSIGLEEYRAESLMSLQRNFTNEYGGVVALYVIHDWAFNGDRSATRNIIHHWRAQRMDELQNHIIGPFPGLTYYGGELQNKLINYYHVARFESLLTFLI